VSIVCTTSVPSGRFVAEKPTDCPANTQPAISAQIAANGSVCGTGKTTARFRSIREFIEWLILGMFLGTCLQARATVTDYKPSAARQLEKGSVRIPPPERIMVDGRPYIIRMVDQLFDGDGDQLDGTTDTKMGIIDIRKNQSIADERDTVLHEVLHSCFDQSIRNYQKKKFTEEDAVRRVTPKLLKVIQENPELILYLLQ
jgi:hypothetical protein